MLSKPNLRKLIKQRIKDAKVLLDNRCYLSSIYIGGYAIELALKYKICKMYKFYLGFPETSQEFSIYYKNPNFSNKKNTQLKPIIRSIKELRIHNLPKLLQYSGDELTIKQNCFNEWSIIFQWNPQIRYKIMPTKKEEAIINLDAIKIILKNIKL